MSFIDKINLPNRLTILRILLVPFFMVIMFVDNLWTRIFVLLVFIMASLTDLYDGKIARETKQVSRIGIFIDPIADKTLISAAMIFFVQLKELGIPAWMIVFIISREYLVTGLRLIATIDNKVMPSDKVGKFKTTSQVIVIITLLVIMVVNSILKKYGINSEDMLIASGCKYYIGLLLVKLPFWTMLAVTILTVYSGITYFSRYGNLLYEKLQDKS